jgi:hypothetical protein
MPKYDVDLPIYPGDDAGLLFHVSELPPGQTLTSAKLTVKASADDPDADKKFQKTISTTYVAGQGQIMPAVQVTIQPSQPVTVADAASARSTTVPLTAVLPLSLPKGLVLVFTSGAALVLSEDAPKYANSIKVNPPTAPVATSETAVVTAYPLMFELTPEETALLPVASGTQQTKWVFDLPVRTSADKRFTPFRGAIYGSFKQVTIGA